MRFCAIALLPLSLSAAEEIHVSPTGDDGNSSTPTHPVAMPQRAQALVRELRTGGLSDAVEVLFAAGTYVMCPERSR